jgi:uncharacterized membrane protein
MGSDVRELDVYVAVYADPDTAQEDWDDLKRLAKEKVVRLDGLVLVSRAEDGKIHVRENAHDVAKGSALGALGGAVVGLIFPPALLASAAVGAGVGAGAGALFDLKVKHDLAADVENVMPPGSSAIVAAFEPRWTEDLDKALAKAERRVRHQVEAEAKASS